MQIVLLKKNDSSYQIASKISNLFQETIEDTMSLVQYEQLEYAAYLLKRAKTIFYAAAGVQVELGRLFQDKMAKIGKNVIVCDHMDIAYTYASNAPEDSAFILVSYSGETQDLLKTASCLQKQNKEFIAITSVGKNSLSSLTHCVLEVSTRERLLQTIGNYSMNLSVLYLLDVLYSCVYREEYVQNTHKKYRDEKAYQQKRHSDNPLLQDDSTDE